MPKANNNSPNPNIAHIAIIEGLIMQVNGHLDALMPKQAGQQVFKQEVIEGLAEWQKIDLYKLRIAFE